MQGNSYNEMAQTDGRFDDLLSGHANDAWRGREICSGCDSEYVDTNNPCS